MISSQQTPSTAPRLLESGRLVAVINPLSFRMSLRDRAQRSISRIKAHGGQAFEACGLAEIEQSLSQAYAEPDTRPIDRIVVAGGDGTLQAAVSWLARHVPADELPDLIVLSAGRTNYVAADVGTGKHFLDTLEKVLSRSENQLHPVHRHTLKLEHPDLGQQIGFFVAAGLVDYVIRDIHDWSAERPTWWRKHHGATAVGIVRFGLRWLTGRTHYQPPTLQINAEPLGRMDGACRLLLMTTLDLTHSIVNPYRQAGDGPLRINAIHADAKAFKRRFPRLARGSFSSEMSIKNGYLSGNCESILINNLDKITVDGQEFDLNPEHPLRVSAGPSFNFLRP